MLKQIMENKTSGKLSKEEAIQTLENYSSAGKWFDWLYLLVTVMFLGFSYSSPDFLIPGILVLLLATISNRQTHRLAEMTNAVRELLSEVVTELENPDEGKPDSRDDSEL